MKARIENDEVVVYRELPSKYKSATLNVAGGFNKMSKEVHESEGFYDVLPPEEYDPLYKELGELYFDMDLMAFTYKLMDVPFDLENKKRELLQQFDDVQDEFERLISRCERIYGKENEGLNTAIATVLQVQRQTVQAINNLTEDVGRSFHIRPEDIDYLKSLFDPYKY